MREIPFHTRDPVFEQVIHYFKVRIANGELQPGEEMPSRRELAKVFDINPNTVQRAYKEMEKEQLIYTESNFPSKITTDQQLLKNVREELIHQAVQAFVESMQMIHVPVDEACIRIKDYLEQEGRCKRND